MYVCVYVVSFDGLAFYPVCIPVSFLSFPKTLHDQEQQNKVVTGDE